MLWSLIKILIFIGLVAALAIGAGMVMETDTGLTLTVAGLEFTLGPLQSVIAAVALLLAVWVLLKIAGLLVATLRFFNGDETAISRYFDRNRERKGYQALADGMLALASGEGRLALVKASRAERYLKRPDLTNLLSAQAAEMTGDRKRAETIYKALLTDDKTRFVGVRGLLKQKLSEGDTDTALKLAEKAFVLKPAHAEMQDTLLRLQAGGEDWSGARKTLRAKLKHGHLPRDVHKRRDAVLALSEAREQLEQGEEGLAHDAAIEANRLSPDLVPAAVMAAQVYATSKKTRYANGVIRKAWNSAPHPELAAAFANTVPDETPEARLRRFAPLFKAHPNHPETRMLKAELLIAAEDFPAARKALGDLYDTQPTTRTLTLLAAIERGEGGDDAVVRGWLARALTAPRGPQWVCDNCQSIQGDWHPVCTNCDSFDTLSWKEPPVTETVLAGGAEMLPLMVASPDKPDVVIADPTDTTEPAETPDPVETPEIEVTEASTPKEVAEEPVAEDKAAPPIPDDVAEDAEILSAEDEARRVH